MLKLFQIVVVVSLFNAATLQAAEPLTFYVSPDGNDANAGTIDKPFATITQARDAVPRTPPGGCRS